MTQIINQFLAPIDRWILNNRKYIGYFFIFLSFCSFGFFFFPYSTKDSGEKALLVLWLIIWIPIFTRVFGIDLFKTLLPLRKELGILMGTLAFVHGAGYLFQFPEFILEKSFWWDQGFFTYLSVGFFALVLSVPLTLTSSNWAIKKLWKNWKRLHRLVYFILIFTVVHVVLIKYSRSFEIGPVIMMVAYFIFKWLEWKWVKLYKENIVDYPKWQLWLCVPCGFVYDPEIGDLDGWIEPGTEFADIPDSWRCPVCGVTKSDFIPYTGDDIKPESATVSEINYLNPTTAELIIVTENDHMSKPGQFVWFYWEDNEWRFQRSYSIVKQIGNQYTFTIKLDPFGRGARVIRWLNSGDKININGVFGNFVLQDSQNPKVFVATGTGLAPIYNMILSMDPSISKKLYFSVATEAELFYVDKLKQIESLDLYIHITREDISGYETGRVDIDAIEVEKDTEWYLCGNPKMVSEAQEKLKNRWFKKVFSEEFS